MRRLLAATLLAVFSAAGCAGHSYREEGDRLHLYLKAGQASAVHFLSSLDGFEPQRTEKTGSGLWQITVPKTGGFRYFYMVDGIIHVPDCRYREKDDFGSYNCLYEPDSQGR